MKKPKPIRVYRTAKRAAAYANKLAIKWKGTEFVVLQHPMTTGWAIKATNEDGDTAWVVK